LIRRPIFTLVAVTSFLMAGCSRAEDTEFGAKVRAYLLAHPEVIEEAVQKLQDNKDAQAALKTKAALNEQRRSLERDPRDFVAHPDGKITVTEFYDYRCPHCINAAPAVMKIIQDNPDVRFVFKEMPIFGPLSEHAARCAIAIKAAGGDYLGFYKTAMSTAGLDTAAVDRIARNYGADPAKADQGPFRTAADAQIKDVHRLADALSVDGTPTFIVGDTVVVGERMDDLASAIAKARKGSSAS
jgi:protein-disulfide isomerase